MCQACEGNGLSCTFHFSTNAGLKRLTEGPMQRAIEQFAKNREKSRLFECFQYPCDTGEKARTE